MAGDHANDVAAARGAGVPCIFAAWGYGPLAMAEGADAVAQGPRDGGDRPAAAGRPTSIGDLMANRPAR